jgi:hypothetical protein
MLDASTLASIASIIAGFGAAILVFRLQRELQMDEKGEPTWIAFADWLIFAATLTSLLLVIFPIVVFDLSSGFFSQLPPASCAAASLMVAGYIPSIFAHYRLIWGKNRTGQRENPEPAERVLVWLTFLIASVVFVLIFADIL